MPAARWSCAWRISIRIAAATYAEAAYDDLRWLGIRWQEGPDRGGPYAPYVQSKRMNAYLERGASCTAADFCFPCKCSRKDLEAALGAPHEISVLGVRSSGKAEPLDDEPIYPGTCRANQGYVPQMRGANDSRRRHAHGTQLALSRAGWRSDRVRRSESRPAALRCRR